MYRGLGGTHLGQADFGQRGFTYTPPTGYLSLAQANLPEPTILTPSNYFKVRAYTGTGLELSVSDFDFDPDLFWGKDLAACRT